jgi:predicted nicotinamide N-methyase
VIETAAAMAPELAALDDRFVLAESIVKLGERDVRLLRPRNSDDLISEADYVMDERLPYWADLWPSAIALAQAVRSLAPSPLRVLELGCGLGLVSIAALLAGHDVVVTDYYADALLFTRRNALAAAGREPRTRVADWRAWPADLGQFDLVLGSDVLYERPYAEQVAAAIASTIVPGGKAFIADPGRTAVPAFLEACSQRGLGVTERARVAHDDGAIHQVITIHEIGARPE